MSNENVSLDELAAAVVGVEEKDLPELERIQMALSSIKQNLSQAAKRLVAEAADLIDLMLSGQCSNTGETLDSVREKIGALVKLIDDETWNDGGAGAADSGEESRATGDEPGEQARGETSEDDGGKTSPSGEAAESEAACSLEVDAELLGEFVTESLEHMQNAEAALLSLESDPEDADAINAVFRAFHTIKGTAGFMGFTDIQKLAHRAENLLDRARNGEIKLTGVYADLALESVDLLKTMIQARVEQPEAVAREFASKVADLIARLENPEKEGAGSDQVIGQASAGDGEEHDPGQVSLGEEKAANGGDRVSPATSQAVQGEPHPAEENHPQRSKAHASAASADSTVRVSTKRLDGLINMVGELVIAQAMVAQNSYVTSERDRTLSRNVARMSKITRELQDLCMSMRMVPLKSTFQKMTRLARDLGKKSGKLLSFVTEGEDTEIDRNMVESLNDPLIHMIRNAVDHGLESRSDRQQAGKPERGTLTLRAYHAAGNVVIELHDDGKGLDREKILRKAVEKGLVEADKELSDSEVFKLIFAPGFSTADKVTDVSGRGVGMDVVKKNIKAMRGRVEVSSTKGKGSTFTIRIPLTLAIIDGMLLRVGSEHYIVPTLNVEQAFRPRAEAISTVAGKGEMVLLRGRLIPIFRLHRLFGISGSEEDPTRALLLVVEHEGERISLLADELLGQQQVVIKSIGKGLGKVEGISGAAILGDGRVGLILDVAGVIAVARGDAGSVAA